MKYLVNRETKEHIVYHEEHSLPLKGWDIVEADSEGWIPWSGGECPLPDDCRVDVRYEGNERCGDRAEEWGWIDIGIEAYRPILTEQSDDHVHDLWTYPEAHKDDVFTRLRTATEHAAKIPSIIAEIDELLGPDYQVVRVEKVEATAPQEDMSDWRNWREGDVLECVNSDGWPCFERGGLYEYVGDIREGGYSGDEDTTINSEAPELFSNDFRFHSRPTGATK